MNKRFEIAMAPATSALLLCGSSEPEHRQKVFERLSQFRPKILESDLPPELEQEVEKRLQGQQRAAG